MYRSTKEEDIPEKMIRAFALAKTIPAARQGARKMKADMEHLIFDKKGNGDQRLVLSPPKMGNPNYDALSAEYFQVFRADYRENEEDYYFYHIAQVQGLDAPDRTKNITVEQCRPFLANCGEIFLVVTEGSLLHQWIADRTTFDDEEEDKDDGNSDTSQSSIKYTYEYQTSDTSNKRTTDSGRHKTKDQQRARSPQGRNRETSKDDRNRGTSTRRDRDHARSSSQDRGRRGDERREDSRPRRDRDNKSKRNRSRSRSHSRDHDRSSQRNRGRSDEPQGRGRMDKGRDRGVTRYVVKSRSPRTPRDRGDEGRREATPREQGEKRFREETPGWRQ